jgi:hypothetical protein
MSNTSHGLPAVARLRERRLDARRDTLALYGPPPTSGMNPGAARQSWLGRMGTRNGDSRGAGRIIFRAVTLGDGSNIYTGRQPHKDLCAQAIKLSDKGRL